MLILVRNTPEPFPVGQYRSSGDLRSSIMTARLLDDSVEGRVFMLIPIASSWAGAGRPVRAVENGASSDS